jgi:Spy/CpxP family protein refolding chaperone
MKCLRIVLTVAATLLFAAVAVAAEEGKPKVKGKGQRLNPIAETLLRIDRIKSAVEGLDLNEEQKQKLAGVRDDFEAKRQAVHEKLGDLLTEDQKRAAQEKLEEAKQSGKTGREVYQSLEAVLKLTDEQKQKMEPIGKELQGVVSATLKQVMEVLSPEQKETLQKKLGMGKKGEKKREK